MKGKQIDTAAPDSAQHEIALLARMYERADKAELRNISPDIPVMSEEGERLTVEIMRLLSIAPYQKKVEHFLSTAVTTIMLHLLGKE